MTPSRLAPSMHVASFHACPLHRSESLAIFSLSLNLSQAIQIRKMELPCHNCRSNYVPFCQCLYVSSGLPAPSISLRTISPVRFPDATWDGILPSRSFHLRQRRGPGESAQTGLTPRLMQCATWFLPHLSPRLRSHHGRSVSAQPRFSPREFCM